VIRRPGAMSGWTAIGVSLAGLIALTGCSSAKKPAASATPTTPASSAASLPAPAGSSPAPAGSKGATPRPARSVVPTAPAIAMPSSCTDGALEAIISPYLGGIATAQTVPGAASGAVSCEFFNAGHTKSLVLNMGPGSIEDFTVLQTSTAASPGVAIQPIGGLGTIAFSITHSGTLGGVDALGANSLVVSVAANLTLSQDEALIRKLIAKY
jgi:hypothetical protein